MDFKIVLVTILYSVTTSAQLLPSPPENVLFQLTSNNSFAISWFTPPEPLHYYRLDYYLGGNTPHKQIAINKTETHYEVVEEHSDLSSFGMRFYSVFDELNSTDAVINVLTEHDPRQPPTVKSATQQRLSPSQIQLQWTLPTGGVYDGLRILYGPEQGGTAPESVLLDMATTSYQLKSLMPGVQYTIHLYTLQNGIQSDPAELQSLPGLPNNGNGNQPCDANPCQNDGECVPGEINANQYTCECAAGFEGTICETNIDECASSPCMNGGECTDGVNSYQCACAPGFGGEMCDGSGGVAHNAGVLLIAVHVFCGYLLRNFLME